MFETIYRRSMTVRKQQAAALAESRSNYLTYLVRQGYTRSTIRNAARDILVVAERIGIVPPAMTDKASVEAAVDGWMRANHHTSAETRHRVVNAAEAWLQFSGMLAEELCPPPCAEQIARYVRYMRDDQGLSPATISSRVRTVRAFLEWFGGKDTALSAITLADVDRYLATKGRETWKRWTVATNGQTLRAFFRYAERQGWCAAGISAGIELPRVYRLESVPLGPTWEQVRALVATTDAGTGRDLRDRAALLLFAVYGLRCSEVRQLRLDDIDWEREVLTVRRSKSRRVQEFPLTREVGDAIIRYVREVRAQCEFREVFITLKAPWRPVSHAGFYDGIRGRIDALGIDLARRGPHALRHACATHLMAEGFTLKEIGDHLGHSSSESTRIYAKVDMAGLREVAELDFGGLQ
jgi:site-specific recombinase XerD